MSLSEHPHLLSCLPVSLSEHPHLLLCLLVWLSEHPHLLLCLLVSLFEHPHLLLGLLVSIVDNPQLRRIPEWLKFVLIDVKWGRVFLGNWFYWCVHSEVVYMPMTLLCRLLVSKIRIYRLSHICILVGPFMSIVHRGGIGSVWDRTEPNRTDQNRFGLNFFKN
jgi:hypothetical protein